MFTILFINSFLLFAVSVGPHMMTTFSTLDGRMNYVIRRLGLWVLALNLSGNIVVYSLRLPVFRQGLLEVVGKVWTSLGRLLGCGSTSD